MGAAGWQRAAPAVRALVACSGGEHLVVWRRGALALAHHELPAEEALAALGGEPPRCLEVVRAWRAGLVDAAPTPHVWFSAGGKGRPPVANVLRRAGRPVLPESLRRARLLTLLLERSPAWAASGEVAARAHRPLGVAVPRGQALAVSGGPEGPVLTRRRGQPLLVLPARWLTHVWARRLELVDGLFVVDAARAPGADGLLRALVLEWDEEGPQLVERRLHLG